VITRSIIAIKDRLVQVEERLAIAKRRRDPYPAVVNALSEEAAGLRAEMWALRRDRWSQASQEAHS